MYARIALLFLAVCLAGCNCGDNKTLCKFVDSTTTSSSTTGTAAGIWTGTDSSTGLALTGYINSEGQADIFRSDGVQYVGTAQVSGTTLTIAVTGYTQYDYAFTDGSTSGSGSFSGTLSSGSSISGTLDFTTNDNTAITTTWSLTYDTLYSTASSLTAVSGTFSDDLAAVSDGADPLSGSSITISSAGVLYAQGSSSGCVANGTVSVVDASDDLYDVTYTLEDCTGSYDVLNGVAFSGQAELDPDASPVEIIFAVTGESSTPAYYGIVSELSAS